MMRPFHCRSHDFLHTDGQTGRAFRPRLESLQ